MNKIEEFGYRKDGSYKQGNFYLSKGEVIARTIAIGIFVLIAIFVIIMLIRYSLRNTY